MGFLTLGVLACGQPPERNLERDQEYIRTFSATHPDGKEAKSFSPITESVLLQQWLRDLDSPDFLDFSQAKSNLLVVHYDAYELFFLDDAFPHSLRGMKASLEILSRIISSPPFEKKEQRVQKQEKPKENQKEQKNPVEELPAQEKVVSQAEKIKLLQVLKTKSSEILLMSSSSDSSSKDTFLSLRLQALSLFSKLLLKPEVDSSGEATLLACLKDQERLIRWRAKNFLLKHPDLLNKLFLDQILVLFTHHNFALRLDTARFFSELHTLLAPNTPVLPFSPHAPEPVREKELAAWKQWLEGVSPLLADYAEKKAKKKSSNKAQ